MEKNNRGIYMVLTTSVLAIAGLVLIIMSFCGKFYDKYDYSTAALTFFAVVFTIIFSVLFNLIQKKWIVWAGFIFLFGIYFMIFREAIIGGAGVAINEVINETSGYFDTEMWYIDISKAYRREANEAMAVYTFILLLSAVYSFCISMPKLTFIPWTVSLVLFVYPLVLEKYPNGFWVLFGIMYLLVMFITAVASVRSKFQIHSAAMFQQAVILFGLIICVVGGIALKANPEKSFHRSEYFGRVYDGGKDLYDRYQRGELAINKLEDFFIALNPFKKAETPLPLPGGDTVVEGGGGPSASGMANTIGAGELGQVDELVFSGQEALQVIMPEVEGKVYVKGFIGATYNNTRWIEPYDDSDGFFHPQTMVSEYLQLAGVNTPVKTYATTMWVMNKTGSYNYKFMPLYPSAQSFDEDDDDVYSDNGTFNNFSEDTAIAFYGFNQSDLGHIDGAKNIAENGGAKFIAREKTYREYVYNNYLKVNTTIADELYEQWGDSYIGGADSRYEVACSIRQYLNDNCRYTTRPGKVPEGRDFVEYFLNETQEGYCTYFATAAIMMLRSAGIPARYVEGYSFTVGASSSLSTENVMYTERNPGSSATYDRKTLNCRIKSVPDSAAHAWVEYYVDGVGWVDFEVTPGNYTVAAERPTETQTTTARPTQAPTTAPSATMAQHTVEHTTQAGGKGGFHFKIKLSKTAERILVCIAAAAALMFAFVMITRVRLGKIQKVYDNIYKAGGSEPGNPYIVRMYKDYMRILKFFGYTPKQYETEADFAVRAAQSCRFVAESEALYMAEIFETATFGKVDITADCKADYLRTYMTVRERMYGNVGIFKKIIIKYILCL